MTSKVSHFGAGYPAVCRNATTLFVVQCVAVALRPTNDPMHGFARPTLRMQKPDAIAQSRFCRRHNMVAYGLLQIQHTYGNLPLRLLTGALKSADSGRFGREWNAERHRGGGDTSVTMARRKCGKRWGNGRAGACGRVSSSCPFRRGKGLRTAAIVDGWMDCRDKPGNDGGGGWGVFFPHFHSPAGGCLGKPRLSRA